MISRCLSGSSSIALLGVACLTLAGCKKSLPQAPQDEAATQAPPSPPSLLDHAPKLGFAAHLPRDTEFYVGTVNLRAHLKAIDQTVYARQVQSFIDDKVPAPSAGAQKDRGLMKKLWGDDLFVALAKGGAAPLKSFNQLNELYSEITYQALMEGGPLAAKAGDIQSQPGRIFQAIASDPVLLRRASEALAGLEMPPLLTGFKVDKPDELLKELFPDETLQEFAAKAKVTDLTTAADGRFRVFEFHVRDFLTDEMRMQVLSGISKGDPNANGAREAIDKAIRQVQTKTVSFAFGSAGGCLILAAGPTMSHLKFATTPKESLLANPDLDFARPYVDKNLLALVSADDGVFEALSSDQPMQSLLRGVVAGLRSSDVFGPLAARLQPKIAEMGRTESRLFKRNHSPMVGVAWWDGGIHFESVGGPDTGMLDYTQPLQFARLLDDPGVLFGMDYHGSREWALNSRDYFEQWMDLIHLVVGELVKSGLGGRQGRQIFQMLDQNFVPQLVSFYRGSRDIYQKALGSEHAVIIDVGGKLSSLPGMTASATDKKMIRIAGVHDVKDRQLISTNWSKMKASLGGMLAAAPTPFPLELPAVEASEKNGITSFYYPIPFVAEELLPCVSVNDRLFILGTSRDLAQDLAGRLGSIPGPATAMGLRWKIGFANVRELIQSSAGFFKSTDAESQAKTTARWLAPFENLDGMCWQERGRRRDSMTWEIHDVVKYD